MTNLNVETKDLFGETPITSEHIQNNKSVRKMLGERGIKPEELPPGEDIKKIERRLKSDEQKLARQKSKLVSTPCLLDKPCDMIVKIIIKER